MNLKYPVCNIVTETPSTGVLYSTEGACYLGRSLSRFARAFAFDDVSGRNHSET